jgi:hypothetical protein
MSEVDLYDLERYRAALDFASWVLDVRSNRWAMLSKAGGEDFLLAETPEGVNALRFLYEAAKVVPDMIRELRELSELRADCRDAAEIDFTITEEDRKNAVSLEDVRRRLEGGE